MAAAGNRTWRPKIEALAERVPSRLHLIWECERRFQLVRCLRELEVNPEQNRPPEGVRATAGDALSSVPPS